MGKSGFTIIEVFQGHYDSNENWLTASGGIGATANVTESGGEINSVTPNALGSGFTSPPTVTISGGGGVGAIVKGVITNGQVTSYVIVDGGVGFTSPTATVTGGAFSLPADYPDNIMAFLHLDFNLIIDTVVKIIKNGEAYSINNDETIVGVAFRSFPIIAGDTFQIRDNPNTLNLLSN